MSNAWFVAGTDTGVGKTHASCALLHALQKTQRRVCGMKPVASGCVETPEGLRNDDAVGLIGASSTPHAAYETVNPIALREPLSPHLAALHEHKQISLNPLRSAFDRLCSDHDAVIVEGVGGWLVPLAPGLFASDIAKTWRLPVILVVGLRLGCLNHALLSAQAIEADGCRLVGWIGNCIDPAMAAIDENLTTLRELLSAPCLGVLPHGVPPVQAADALADAMVLLS
jgi:dethiobiotin synthetase